jgi:hypothetical protein
MLNTVAFRTLVSKSGKEYVGLVDANGNLIGFPSTQLREAIGNRTSGTLSTSGKFFTVEYCKEGERPCRTVFAAENPNTLTEWVRTQLGEGYTVRVLTDLTLSQFNIREGLAKGVLSKVELV